MKPTTRRLETWITEETLISLRVIQLQTGDTLATTVRQAISDKIEKHRKKAANFTEIRNSLLTSLPKTVDS